MYVRASHVCLVLIEVRRGHLSWAVVAHAFNPSTMLLDQATGSL